MNLRNKLAGMAVAVSTFVAAPVVFAQTTAPTSIATAVGGLSVADASAGEYGAIGLVLGLAIIALGAAFVIRMVKRG
ncbi:UNVERIFIED_ORG: hypothetical protein J2Y81_000759 [Paraburkholderia sediminicola]|nr:hypothetical protein [Paraburkholderia sediminicola]